MLRTASCLLPTVYCLLLACGGGGAGQELARPRAGRVEVRQLQPAPGALALPAKTTSVKFAVIGDSGRGDDGQRAIAQQMAAWRHRFPFDFVLMLGDNIYDSHTPQDYIDKFESPYAPLLDAGVTFHAAIGNHDDAAQVYYEKFNMGGNRYYTFRKAEGLLGGVTGAGVRFFALDSRSLDPEQMQWLRDQLRESGSEWKICFFHHPIYTSGRYQSGAAALRHVLEPVLVAGDVDVVLSGHEHFYERIHPQRGIAYFVSGGAGSLRKGDIRTTALTAKGFDTDFHFMLMEITGRELHFQAIGRDGATVDAGVIVKSRARSE